MRKTLTNIFLRWLSLTVFCSVTFTGAAWFLDTYSHYQQDIKEMRQAYTQEQHTRLKERVDQAIEHITYMRSKLSLFTEKTVTERTDIARMIISGLSNRYKDSLSHEEFADLVRESLRNIRYPDQGYYFALDMNGVVTLFTDHPEREGENLLQTMDINRRQIPQNILKRAKNDTTVLYTYPWTKPGQGEKKFPKVAAIRYIPELDWVIGTGMYLDDTEKLIKQNALNWLNNLRFGKNKDEYIFVGTWDGLSLAGPGEGKIMLSITDQNGVHIVKELIAKARSGGGFINYVMPKFKSGRPMPKLSYSAPIKEWQWYIGTGRYIDEIDSLIENRRQQLQDSLVNHIYQIGVLLLILGTFALIIVHLMGKRLRKNVTPLTNFFNKAAKNFVPLDENQFDFLEFHQVAKDANEMVREQDRTHKLLSTQEHLLTCLTRANHQLLSGTDIDLAVSKTLAILGSGCAVERISLFETSSSDSATNTMSLCFEWCDNVSSMQKDPRFQSIPFTSFTADWVSEFLKGTPFQGRSEDLVPEGNALMNEYGIKSTLLLPIMYRGSLWGVLSFDACRESVQFSEHTIQSLQNFSSSLCAAVTQRRSEQESVRIRNQWVSTFDSISDAIFVLNDTCQLLDANHAALRIAETDSISSIRGQHISSILHGEFGNRDRCLAEHSLEQKKPLLKEVYSALHHKTYLSSAFPMRDNNNHVTGVIFIARDVSNEKNMERQIAQTQKMEAIGVLAGGIAHDFNNILAAIMGFTELAQIKVQQERTEGIDRDLDQIFQAGERAKDLVVQLLAFSRNQDNEQTLLTVTPIIKETIKMLQAFLPANIVTTTNLSPETRKTLANGTALHQVFMNLANNAAQAMQEDGGELHISLEEVELTTAQQAEYQVSGGKYLHLEFRDQGKGIDPGIVDKIYDPFFTTKKQGDGTGMGLAAVHGITEAHRGCIALDNRVGEGATFHVYLPQSDEAVETKVETVNSKELQPAHYKTILVVDDEEMLLTMYHDIFTLLGCTAIIADRPGKALMLLEKHPEIDLLCTDMNMPEMNGLKLAEQCHAIRPDLPVLLCSGLTINLKREEVQQAGINVILEKPLTLQSLLDTLNSSFTCATEPVL